MEILDSKGRSWSRPEWTALETYARGKVEELLQALLDAEVTDVLGRGQVRTYGQGGWR